MLTPKISPKFSFTHWTDLDLADRNSSDWKKAVDIFRDRIHGRFLTQIQVMEGHPNRDIRNFCGFAILALDCLLIETLQQFYQGWDETPKRKSKEAFQCFFATSSRFCKHFDSKKSEMFYEHVRCGILHQAQTKAMTQIRIRQHEMICFADPANEQNGLIVDRKKFHKALCGEIDDYIGRLLNDIPDYDVFRNNFIKKMNFIAQ